MHEIEIEKSVMLSEIDRILKAEHARSCQQFKFSSLSSHAITKLSASAAKKDTDMMNKLINAGIIVVLSNLHYNTSLQTYLRVYLIDRPRPTHNLSLSADLLQLDILVVKLYLSVLASNNHKLLSNAMKVTDENCLLDAYCSLLNRTPLMTFTDILNLCCILGDSNMHIAQRIMQRILEARPVSHVELLTHLHDVERTAMGVEQVIIALARPTEGKKAPKLSATSVTSQWCDSAETILSITYTTSMLLQSAQPTLTQLGIFTNCGANMTSFGVILITALCTCFDKIIPQLDAATGLNTAEKQRIAYVQLIARERCVMAIFALLSVAASSTSLPPIPIANRAMADEVQRSQAFGWEEVLHMLVMGSEALAVDLSKCYPAEFRNLVFGIYRGDEGQAQYYLDIVSAAATALKSAVEDARKVAPVKIPAATPAQVAAVDTRGAVVAEAVTSMKGIFPDYSDLFLRTCLEAFDMSVERAVDALFSENLPPSLSTMDRRAVSIWQGKASNDRSFVLTRHDGSQSQQQKAINLNKDKIRQLEKQAYEDSQLLLSDVPPLPAAAPIVAPAESGPAKISSLFANRHSVYADDYDDQYDDIMPVKIGFNESSMDKETETHKVDLRAIDTSSEMLDKQGGTDTKKKRSEKKAAKMEQKAKQAAGAGTWQQERDTILRLNKLLLEEEREDAFWQEMANTNTPKQRETFNNGEESEESDSAAMTEATSMRTRVAGGENEQRKTSAGSKNDSKAGGQNKNKQSQRRKNGSSERPDTADAATTEKKKHRTKTFDKHHQKDKSLRKGGFS